MEILHVSMHYEKNVLSVMVNNVQANPLSMKHMNNF